MVQLATQSIAQPVFNVDTNGNPVTPPSAPPVPLTSAAQDSTGAGKAPVYTFLTQQRDVAVVTSTQLTVPATARYAIVQAKGAAVKYAYDGATTPPTATAGMTLANGGELALDIAKVGMDAMRFIQAAATATLDVAYFS